MVYKTLFFVANIANLFAIVKLIKAYNIIMASTPYQFIRMRGVGCSHLVQNSCTNANNGGSVRDWFNLLESHLL